MLTYQDQNHELEESASNRYFPADGLYCHHHSRPPFSWYPVCRAKNRQHQELPDDLTSSLARFDSLSIFDTRALLTYLAFWLVAYTLIVFGSEQAFRAFQRKRFQPRAKYSVSICWSIVAAMLIATWIPSNINKNPDNECVATILSWVMPWTTAALALNSIAVFSFLLLAFLISYQLSRTMQVERTERVAASISVYYLTLAGILMSTIIPFWARVISRKSTNSAATTATITVNIYGLLTSLLYLILKSTSNNMTFRPAAASWDPNQEWRLFGSPKLDIGKHLTSPVMPHQSNNFSQFAFSIKEKGDSASRTTISRVSSRTTAKDRKRSSGAPPFYRTHTHKSSISKPSPTSPPAYRTPPLLSSGDPLLRQSPDSQLPPQTLRSDSTTQPFGQNTYALFPPRKDSIRNGSRSKADIPPRKPVTSRIPLFFNAHQHQHQRDTSDVSTATVQIGMRLSNFPGGSDLQDHILRRSVTYPTLNEAPKALQLRSPPVFAPLSLNAMLQPTAASGQVQQQKGNTSPHEILFRLNSQEELSPHPVPPNTSSLRKPLEDLVSPTRKISSWRQFRDTRMKSLPPVPVSPTSALPHSPALRASYPEPGTPVSLTSTVRESRDRAALSVALRENEEWPLQGLLVPTRTYIPVQKRSWI